MRLLTGQPVKRYVSALKILYCSEFVARSLGYRFASILREFKSRFPEYCLVAGSPASRFISGILLQDHTDLNVAELPNTVDTSKPVVIFTDAIYKGERLRAILQQIKTCVGIICLVDLRSDPQTPVADREIPLIPLLTFPFDPGEVSLDLVPSGSEILEVDAVTHFAEKSIPSAETWIGTSRDREDFVNSNPQLFCYGIHRSGEHIHIVTLSVDAIIKNFRTRIIDWMVEEIDSCMKAMKVTKGTEAVVMFSRQGESVGDIIEEVGLKLKHLHPRMRAFRSTIPNVMKGPYEVFGRPAGILFHALTEIGSAELFLDKEPSKFIAIFVDDACVTGKTLKSFLIRAASSSTPASAVIVMPVVSRFSTIDEILHKKIITELAIPSGDKKHIPFRFCPLFRLQVGYYEALHSTPAYELVSKLLIHKPYLHEKLRTYIDSIAKNLESVALRTYGDILTCQHPFYDRQQSGKDAVSVRTIHIRQLISLQNQNVGVLGELLRLIKEACDKRDYSLLTMLAVEPSLIEVSPLNKECRRDIMRLAVTVLSSDTTSELKSDALSVLSYTGQNLVEAIPTILPDIARDSTLTDQFLVFLLTHKPATNFVADDIASTLEKCKSVISSDSYHYIRDSIRAYDDAVRPTTIKNREDAIRAIKRLTMHLSYHGNALLALNNVKVWLTRREEDRSAVDGVTIRSMMSAALSSLSNFVLVGIDGLAYLSEEFYNNAEATADLKTARTELMYNINRLHGYSLELSDGPIGTHLTQQIDACWNRIRKYSFRNPPELFLSQSDKSGEQDLPVLERWMPKFFALPFEIINNLCSLRALPVTVIPNWKAEKEGSGIVVVEANTRDLREMFDLLLSDMEKHGNHLSDTIGLFCVVTEARMTLVIRFSDYVRENDLKGTGGSQSRVRSIANQHDISVEFDPPRRAGELYNVEMIFPRVLNIAR